MYYNEIEVMWLETMKSFNEQNTTNDNSDVTKEGKLKDAAFKHIFKNTFLLSFILKYAASEYEDMDIEDIKGCICDMEVGSKRVERYIHGEDTESNEKNEATIKYDIFFTAKRSLDESEGYFIFFDIEGQNRLVTEYPIPNRSTYYASRMISQQISDLSDSSVYNELKKVHSIWIFPVKSGEEYSNEIVTYAILRKKGRYGKFDSSSDLMEITYIFVSDASRFGEEEVMSVIRPWLFGDFKKGAEIAYSYGENMKKEAQEMDGLVELWTRKAVEENTKEVTAKVTEEVTTKVTEEGKIDRLEHAIKAINRRLLRGELITEDTLEDLSLTKEECKVIIYTINKYPDKEPMDLARIILKERRNEMAHFLKE